MIATRNRTWMVALSIVAMCAAAPALAHGGPGGPPPGRPSGIKALYSRGLLGQLIFPCEAECASTAETCAETAEAEALSCISSACPDEVTTAQTACGADRSSSDCKDAVAALYTCGSTCLTTHSTAVMACRTTQNDCRTACSSSE